MQLVKEVKRLVSSYFFKIRLI